MNEQHDEASEQEQGQVSRLLAAAGGPPPELPHDVAARLDDVLAGLVADRDAGPVPADEVTGVTQIAPRRRRRWPQLLVAAAAVSVLGIGLGNVVQPGQEDATTADSAGSAADKPRVAQRENAVEGSAPLDSAPQKSESERSAAKDQDGPVLTGSLSELDRQRLRLQRESLTVDVQRIEDFGLAVPVADTQRQWADACVRPETGAGAEWLPVRLDGDAAVLVLGAPAAGRRTAEVFTCDEGNRPAVSTTIDAR
jgi:hypothetical protein